MRAVRDLTVIEIAELLHEAYLEDRGLGATGPDPVTRQELADLIGCHPELRDAVWDEWRWLMVLETVVEDDAEYWLDAEFVHPRPEDIHL